MQVKKVPTDHTANPHGLGGLGDAEQRSLIRLIFLATVITLGFFALLQLSQSNVVLATIEILATTLLLW